MPPAMQWWLGKCKATATRLTQTNDVQQQLQVYTAYRMGYELLMLNGMLTYCGLYGTSYENDNENE